MDRAGPEHEEAPGGRRPQWVPYLLPVDDVEAAASGPSGWAPPSSVGALPTDSVVVTTDRGGATLARWQDRRRLAQ